MILKMQLSNFWNHHIVAFRKLTFHKIFWRFEIFGGLIYADFKGVIFVFIFVHTWHFLMQILKGIFLKNVRFEILILMGSRSRARAFPGGCLARETKH